MNLILLLIFVCSCNTERLTENERKICVNNFVRGLISMSPYFELTDRKILDIEIPKEINFIINDVRSNIGIKESRDKIISLSNNIINRSDRERFKYVKNESAQFIEKNLNKFKKNELKFIEELDFVNQLFMGFCEIGWTEGKHGFDINFHNLDTILLFENTDYLIPIEIKLEGKTSTPFKIISNTLQKEKGNEVFIKTGKSDNKIRVKKFEIEANNILTGENWKKLDSIKYIIIKSQ